MTTENDKTPPELDEITAPFDADNDLLVAWDASRSSIVKVPVRDGHLRMAALSPEESPLVAQYDFSDPGSTNKRYIYDQVNGRNLYKSTTMSGTDFWDIEDGAGTWWNANVFTPKHATLNRTDKQYKGDFQPLWKGYTGIFLRLKFDRDSAAQTSPAFRARLTEDVEDSAATATPTYTQATPATITDVDGLVHYTKVDEAGFLSSQRTVHDNTTDYDVGGATGVEYITRAESKGVLIEDARANLCLYSDDLSNAAWDKTNVVVRPDIVTAPDGRQYQCRLKATAGNAELTQDIVSIEADRVFSVWMRRVVGSGDVDITVDGTTWDTQTLTNSWARYTTTLAAETDPTVGVRIVTSGDEIDFIFAQCENGAFETSYIPTIASSVTRNKDVLSYNVTPETNNIVLACDFTPWEDTGDTHHLVTSYNAASDYLQLAYDGTDFIARKRVSTVNYDATLTVDIVKGTTYRVVGRFNDSDGVDIWVDGVKGTPDSDTSAAVVGTSIEIGAFNGSAQSAASYRNVKYYDEDHTDAECAILSATSNGMILGTSSGPADGFNTETGFGIYLDGEGIKMKITQAGTDTAELSVGIRDNDWNNYMFFVDPGNEMALVNAHTGLSTKDISSITPFWMTEDEQIFAIGGRGDTSTQQVKNISIDHLEWYHALTKPQYKKLFRWKVLNKAIPITSDVWQQGYESNTVATIKAGLTQTVDWDFGTNGNITSIPQLYTNFHTRLSFGTPRGTAQTNASQWSRHRENPGMEAYSDLGANYDAAGADVHVLTDSSLQLLAILDPDMTDGNISSGYIRAKEAFWSGRYGYYEMRFRLIAQGGSQGHWSAFWMTSIHEVDETNKWPPEIDIFEIVTTGTGVATALQAIHHATHGPESNEGGTVTFSRCDVNNNYVPEDNLNTFESWHTAGLWWTKDKVSWYVDGVKTMEQDWQDGWSHPAAGGGGDGGNAQVIANMSVGGSWPGDPDDEADFPMGMEIDYIKIWE